MQEKAIENRIDVDEAASSVEGAVQAREYGMTEGKGASEVSDLDGDKCSIAGKRVNNKLSDVSNSSESISQESSEKVIEFIVPTPDPTVAAPKRGGLGYLATKRTFDVLFSLVVCIVFSVPLILACAAIVVESLGGPIFRRNRIGKGGRIIRIFKLRTMMPDAHDHPERYMSPEQLTKWRREQKINDDSRVTKVGRFLRRTSLDEVMQFLNVLSGDIPSRILKMRPELSSKSMGAFALPVKSSTNESKAFSQVASCFASGLRMCRIPEFNCKRVGSMEGQFLAKLVFGAVGA